MKFWKAYTRADIDNPTYAIMSDRRLEPADLNAEEIARAHGALAYLKAKIGNDRMQELLADDIAETTKRTGDYARNSGGWKSANFRLVVPGPGAAEFHHYFLQIMKEDRQLDLRAGHPDHFMNLPLGPTAKVIENVGEDDLPWYIELEFTDDQERFPEKWDDAYPERLERFHLNPGHIRHGRKDFGIRLA